MVFPLGSPDRGEPKHNLGQQVKVGLLHKGNWLQVQPYCLQVPSNIIRFAPDFHVCLHCTKRDKEDCLANTSQNEVLCDIPGRVFKHEEHTHRFSPVHRSTQAIVNLDCPSQEIDASNP